MSSSTALLPKKRDDHPIFLRVCHAPWTTIGQTALVGLRSLVATYMLVSFAMLIDYELKHTDDGWLTAFKFSNVSYFTQALYQLMAATWTFMHLHYPHHGSSASSDATSVQRLLSPPRQNASTKNREWFSIFYTVANTWPFLSAFIHWALMIPDHKAAIPADQIFGHGWFTTFYVLNKWGVSALLALIEIVFLSSIRRQTPVGAHVAGVSVTSIAYIGWSYLGYIFTDKYSFFFFDHKQLGWEYVVLAWIAFVVAANMFFAIVYGLTAVREQLTKKSESKNSGYQQLPK